MKHTLFLFSLLTASLLAAGESYSALMSKAQQAAKNKDFTAAEKYYLEASAAGKNSGEKSTALFRLGNMQNDRKMYDAAIDSYEKMSGVKHISKHDIGVSWRAIAKVKMKQGKTRDAIQYYRQAGNLKAGTWIDAVANAELAEIYENLGWYKEALETWQNYASLPKLDTESRAYALAGMVRAKAKTGDFAGAEKDMAELEKLEGSIKNPKTKIIIRMTSAQLLDAKKEWKKAIEEYRAVRKMPKLHYKQSRMAANRAAAIALRELKDTQLAAEIIAELKKTDKYGADEELVRELKKAQKK